MRWLIERNEDAYIITRRLLLLYRLHAREKFKKNIMSNSVTNKAKTRGHERECKMYIYRSAILIIHQ